MDLHAAALGAVARSRSVGLHFWGQILGVTPLNSQPGHTRMRLVPESTALPRSSGARQPVDVTALATVADITSGLAVRSQVTGRNRLATISFSLQQVQPAYGAVTCHSELVWTEPGGERSLVRAQLTDGTDALVATAQAWFLTLPLSERATLTPMPWERTAAAVPHLTAADLSETELAAATAATLACGRATSAGTSLARELLGLEWTERTEERIVGQAPVDAHLSNRVGNVQGGALLGFTATTAAELAGADMVLADTQMQYLRPVSGERLTVTASTLSRGRRAHFLDAQIEVDGVVTNTARLTFLATAGTPQTHVSTVAADQQSDPGAAVPSTLPS